MTLEELYKDLHSHPELAFAEHRTAAIAAEWLASSRASGTLGGPASVSGAGGRRAGVDVRFDVASVTSRQGDLVVEVIEGAF